MNLAPESRLSRLERLDTLLSLLFTVPIFFISSHEPSPLPRHAGFPTLETISPRISHWSRLLRPEMKADMSSKGPIVDDEGLYDLVVTADVRIQHRSSSAGSAGDGEGIRSGRGKSKDRSQRRAELIRRYSSLIAKSELHLRRKDDRASLKKARRAAAGAADVPSASASLKAAAADDVASASASASLCVGAADVASASASLSAAAVDMQRQRDQARRKIAAMEKTVDISDGSCVEVAAFGEVAALRLRSFSRTLFECVTNFKLIDEEVEYISTDVHLS